MKRRGILSVWKCLRTCAKQSQVRLQTHPYDHCSLIKNKWLWWAGSFSESVTYSTTSVDLFLRERQNEYKVLQQRFTSNVLKGYIIHYSNPISDSVRLTHISWALSVLPWHDECSWKNRKSWPLVEENKPLMQLMQHSMEYELFQDVLDFECLGTKQMALWIEEVLPWDVDSSLTAGIWMKVVLGWGCISD